MSEDTTIRPEADEDQKAIWILNRTAFESETEAHLVDALRDGGFVDVSLVAEIDGLIVGHILFSRLPIITGCPQFHSRLLHRGYFFRLARFASVCRHLMATPRYMYPCVFGVFSK